MAETYIGDFSLPGRSLRRKGINRIGNLLVPNDVSMKWHLDATHDVQCQVFFIIFWSAETCNVNILGEKWNFSSVCCSFSHFRNELDDHDNVSCRIILNLNTGSCQYWIQWLKSKRLGYVSLLWCVINIFSIFFSQVFLTIELLCVCHFKNTLPRSSRTVGLLGLMDLLIPFPPSPPFYSSL